MELAYDEFQDENPDFRLGAQKKIRYVSSTIYVPL